MRTYNQGKKDYTNLFKILKLSTKLLLPIMNGKQWDMSLKI